MHTSESAVLCCAMIAGLKFLFAVSMTACHPACSDCTADGYADCLSCADGYTLLHPESLPTICVSTLVPAATAVVAALAAAVAGW